MGQTYRYRARDHDGNIVKGKIHADSKQQVIAYLHQRNCYINFVEEQQERVFTLVKGIDYKTIVLFCRQLAIMINCGLPLLSAVKILIEESQNGQFKKILYDIYTNLEQGTSLAVAMETHTKIFPQIIIPMIKAGELGGVLDKVLTQLSLYLEKDYKLKQKVKTAMIYPVFIFVLSIAMVMVIMIFVMPVYVTVFSNNNIELPLLTKMLFNISTYVQTFYGVFLLAVGCLILFLVKLYQLPNYRIQGDKIILKTPWIGKISMKCSIARYTRTLGTLLEGGIPLLAALSTAKNVMENYFLRQSLACVELNLKDGFSLSDSLRQEKIFDAMVIQMIAIGEQTGNLEVILYKIAEFYENDSEEMVARFNSLLEPIIIVFLGIVIGGILIAIALPMFDSIMYSV